MQTPANTPEPITAADRVRAELREAWEQPAFSAVSIDVEKWTAVYLPIPGDATSGLLLLARDAAADCFREAGESEPRVPNDAPEWTRDVPNATRFWNAHPDENASDAKARVAELDRLIEPNPQVTLDFLETKFETAAPPMSRDEAWEQPAFSLETVKANKWTAVYLPIPENADPLLLDQASFAAFACFNEQVSPQADDAERFEWQDHHEFAAERVKELGDRMEAVWDTLNRAERKDLTTAIDNAEAVRAWEAPAFSFDTISADPWTACYLPIPENAGRELLEHARVWAADLAEYAARDHGETQGVFTGPLITMPADAPEPMATATARMAELDERVSNQHSRWTGEPLGEAAGVGQSAGKGQSQG